MIVLYGIAGILLSSAGCRPDETLVARVDAVCDANVRCENRCGRWVSWLHTHSLIVLVDGSLGGHHRLGLPD